MPCDFRIRIEEFERNFDILQALAKMGKKTVKLILHLKGMDLTTLLVDDQVVLE